MYYLYRVGVPPSTIQVRNSASVDIIVCVRGSCFVRPPCSLCVPWSIVAFQRFPQTHRAVTNRIVSSVHHKYCIHVQYYCNVHTGTRRYQQSEPGSFDKCTAVPMRYHERWIGGVSRETIAVFLRRVITDDNDSPSGSGLLKSSPGLVPAAESRYPDAMAVLLCSISPSCIVFE